MDRPFYTNELTHAEIMRGAMDYIAFPEAHEAAVRFYGEYRDELEAFNASLQTFDQASGYLGQTEAAMQSLDAFTNEVLHGTSMTEAHNAKKTLGKTAVRAALRHLRDVKDQTHKQQTSVEDEGDSLSRAMSSHLTKHLVGETIRLNGETYAYNEGYLIGREAAKRVIFGNSATRLEFSRHHFTSMPNGIPDKKRTILTKLATTNLWLQLVRNIEIAAKF